MEKYYKENGMQKILYKLSYLQEDTFIGTVPDRALLLDYKATLEKNIGKAVKPEKEAVSLLSPVTPKNAHLAANLYWNQNQQPQRINIIRYNNYMLVPKYKSGDNY